MKKRGSGLGLSLSLALVIGVLCPISAVAEVGPLEVREYGKDFNVSPKRAEEVLELQDRATETNLVGDLEARLGSRYAGSWFDNQSGEFVVPQLTSVSGGEIQSTLAGAGLGADYRTTPVRSSWQRLEAAQEQLTATLSPAMIEEELQTSLDPRTNSVVVHAVEDVGPRSRGADR